MITTVATNDLARLLSGHLRAHKSALMQETNLHEAIALTLSDAQIRFTREYQLSRADRLDFWLPESRTAVEVKKRTASLNDLRQIARYLEHEQVAAVIVIALRISPEIPDEFLGKPIAKIELWRFLL